MRSYYIIPPLCLALLLSWVFSHQEKKPSLKPSITQVETSKVSEAFFADEFTTLGSLSSSDNIEISSELAGQIASIHFTPGAFVRKGVLLIQLDDTVLKSELASAEANFLLSQANFKRINELGKRKLISEQAMDQALADLKEKENTVKARRAQLKKLSLNAPFSGTLGSKQVSVGQYVKVGQALVSLIANKQLRVEYSLPERLISQVKLDQTVHIYSDAYPEYTFTGKVNYIAPAVDQDTRTIAVEALIDNPDNLLSAGLFVRVSHQLGNVKRRLLIPEESLIPTINGQKVFVLQGTKAVTLQVKIGAHHHDMAEICQGLTADDIVIIRGQHKLKEGSDVIAINQNGD